MLGFVTSDNGTAPGQLDNALEAVNAGVAEAAEIVRATTDPRSAFDLATRLASTLRDATSFAAQIRAEMAARIWQTEELSLAGLAQRLGVSKARAAQLVNAAKTGTGTQEGSNDDG